MEKTLNIILFILLMLSFGGNAFMLRKINNDIKQSKIDAIIYYDSVIASNYKIDSLRMLNVFTVDTIYKIRTKIISSKNFKKEYKAIRPDLDAAKKILGI